MHTRANNRLPVNRGQINGLKSKYKKGTIESKKGDQITDPGDFIPKLIIFGKEFGEFAAKCTFCLL